MEALASLVAGAPWDERTAKLYVAWKTLRMRAEHAEAFAGGYEPVDLGDGICAFVRDSEVLVAAAVRPGVVPVTPAGWHDALGVDGLLLALRDPGALL